MPFPTKPCSSKKISGGSSRAVSEDSFDGSSSSAVEQQQHKTSMSEAAAGPQYPIGTLVKKYMNGHGWCHGSVIGMTPSGEYRVRMDHASSDATTTCYPPSAMPRLTKTAHVREGSRVTILWPAARAYYAATVRKENPRKRENFQISYDGQPNPADREWIDLQRHRFRILQPPPAKIVKRQQSPVVGVSTVRKAPSPTTLSATAAPTAATVPTEPPTTADAAEATAASIESVVESSGCKSEVGAGKDGGEIAPTVGSNGQKCKSPTPDDSILRIVSEGSNSSSVAAAVKSSPTLLFSSSSSEDEEEEEDDDEASLKMASTESCDAVRVSSSADTEPMGENGTEESKPGAPKEERSTAKPKAVGNDKGVESEQEASADECEGTATVPLAVVISGGTASSQAETSPKLVEAVKSSPTTRTKKKATMIETPSPRSVAKRKTCDHDEGDSDEMDGNCVTIDPVSDRSTRAIVNTLIGVGSRVAVYWGDDDKFYPATVTNSRSRGVPFFLEYDDGEEEWIDLRTHKFRILGDYGTRRMSASSTASSTDAARKRPPSSPATPRRRIQQLDSPTTPKSTSSVAGKTDRNSVTPAKVTRSSSTPTSLSASPATPASEPRRTRSVDSIRIELPKKKSKRRRVTTEEPPSSAILTIRVGTRVAVWWADDERYYVGTVEKERVHAKPFYLVYDQDDEGEWIDFQSHMFCVMPSVPPEGKKRGRKTKEEGNGGEVKVGSSISIWWSNIAQYMEGTVTRKRGDSFFIKYEKQPGHWIELSKYSYRLERSEEPETPTVRDSGSNLQSSSSKKSPTTSSNSHFLRNPNRDGTGRFTSKSPDATASSVLSAITVGTRVSVFWEGDAKYYKGVVTRERKQGKKRHFLEYDDGIGSHWIDFANHWVRILPKSGAKRRNSANSITAPSPVTNKEPALKKLKRQHDKNDASPNPQKPVTLEMGCRLEVWWSGDEEYFKGTVTKQGKAVGKYFIDYDDGTQEWINLNHQEYRLIRGGGRTRAPKGRPMEKATSVPRNKKRTETVQRQPNEDAAASEESSGDDSDASESANDYYKYDDFVLGAVDKIRVGSKISVWWSAEQRYFDCTLKKIDMSSRKSYFLVYDDDDEEWTDLRRRYFRILKR